MVAWPCFRGELSVAVSQIWKWAEVINSMVSPSASDAGLLLRAWVAPPKNGSLVPEELPGICSSLFFSFIPICKVNNIHHVWVKTKELCASAWALFGPKWWLSSETSMGNYCMLCWGYGAAVFVPQPSWTGNAAGSARFQLMATFLNSQTSCVQVLQLSEHTDAHGNIKVMNVQLRHSAAITVLLLTAWKKTHLSFFYHYFERS